MTSINILYWEARRILKVYIKLNSVQDVIDFVNIVSKKDFDIDILQDRYILNAKSLLALFSLDLSREVEVILNTYTEDSIKCLKDIRKYLGESTKSELDKGLRDGFNR